MSIEKNFDLLIDPKTKQKIVIKKKTLGRPAGRRPRAPDLRA